MRTVFSATGVTRIQDGLLYFESLADWPDFPVDELTDHDISQLENSNCEQKTAKSSRSGNRQTPVAAQSLRAMFDGPTERCG